MWADNQLHMGGNMFNGMTLQYFEHKERKFVQTGLTTMIKPDIPY